MEPSGKLLEEIPANKPISSSKPIHQTKQVHQETKMKQFFNKITMCCESKDPRIQQACNILASEELKNFVCVAVVCLIAVNGLAYLKDPFMKCMGFYQKKINNMRRSKKTPARVPQPCVLKVESRVDIERWVNQARLFVKDFDEGRRAEVVMMLVDEQQRDRRESHCFDKRGNR